MANQSVADEETEWEAPGDGSDGCRRRGTVGGGVENVSAGRNVGSEANTNRNRSS